MPGMPMPGQGMPVMPGYNPAAEAPPQDMPIPPGGMIPDLNNGAANMPSGDPQSPA